MILAVEAFTVVGFGLVAAACVAQAVVHVRSWARLDAAPWFHRGVPGLAADPVAATFRANIRIGAANFWARVAVTPEALTFSRGFGSLRGSTFRIDRAGVDGIVVRPALPIPTPVLVLRVDGRRVRAVAFHVVGSALEWEAKLDAWGWRAPTP